MADPFLSAIGVDDSEADKPTAYEPVDAALRTVYAEASPQAGPDELRAIASVIANRAKATGKDVGAVVQQPGQFEPWATEKGRARIAALTPDGPEYQTMHDLVGGILMGDEDPSTDATHFYAPAAQAALAPVDGRPAKPAWDDGSGHQVGDHIFIAAPGQLTPKDPGDAFLSAIGVAPEEAAKAGEPEAKWAGAGITPYKGSESTLTAAQQKTYETLVKGSAMEEGAEPGSIRNPLWEGPEGSAKDAPPGSFYVTAAGKLERAPGGQKMSSAVAGGVQGLGDVATTLANVLPGTGNSEVANRLRASQMGYGAEYGGDLKSGLARFTGQVVGSAPLLAVGEAAIAPQLASRLGGVGAFLTGQAGKDMAPGALRLLTRAGSLAAHGGAQGAGAAGLISSASDRPVGEQMGEGAVGGAFLGPVAPAVGAAGRWLGTTARSLTRPLTEGGQQGIVGDLLHEVAGGAPTLDLNEYVPGSQPTLAEAAANAGISGLERVTRTNPTLAQRFQVRLQANDEARTQFLHDLRGDHQTAADLAAARQPVVDAARERTFAATTPADAAPVVQAIDEALASPEAHMESVAKPLQALRDKVVQPPPEMSSAEKADLMGQVAATFGGTGKALTPEVMDAARSKLGAKFEDIAGRTNVLADAPLLDGLDGVVHDASQVLEADKIKPLQNLVESIKSTIKNGAISGASYKALIRRGGPLDVLSRVSPDGSMRHYAGQMRDVLDEALERTMSSDFPGDKIPQSGEAFAPEDVAPKQDLTDRALNYLRGQKGEAESQGPSLVDALIKAGGVKNDSELGTLDLQKSYGKRGGLLGRNTGMTLGDAAIWAQERGYIGRPVESGERADGQTLLDALRQDLDGKKIYAKTPDEVKAHAGDLDEMLSELGIDPKTEPNGRIKQRLAEYFGTSDFNPPPAAEAPKPAGKLDSLFEATRNRRADAERLAAVGKPVEFEGKDGVRILVGPDMSKPGGWRKTYVQADGQPSGHVEFSNPTDAFMDAMSGGAKPKGDAAASDPAAGRAALDELRGVRLQYKNLKTAEAALRSAGPDFVPSPRALLNAVKQNFGSYAYKGGGPLGDVAEAAVKAQEAKAPKVETDPRQLYGMRESLSTAIDKLESQGTDAAHLAASRLRTVMDRLDNSISTGAPDYANFRAVAERSNDPIEAMKYLNGLTLTDASGKPTLANVQRARTKIEAARNAPGKSPAKLISAATLEQLGALESDLKRASNIDLGKARGSDTRQNLATDGLAAQMGVPLALGAGALTHHPLVAPAVVGAKLVYGMKDKEIAGKLASRLLDPSAAPPAPIPVPVRSGRGPARRVGAAVLPAVGGILANRLTRGQ